MTEGTVCPAPHPVIPAQAGTHLCRPRCPMAWAPACAGVTGVSLPYRPGESRDLDHGQCPVGPGSGILPGRLGGVNPCAHNARESLPCTPPCHPRAGGGPSLPPALPDCFGPPPARGGQGLSSQRPGPSNLAASCYFLSKGDPLCKSPSFISPPPLSF